MDTAAEIEALIRPDGHNQFIALARRAAAGMATINEIQSAFKTLERKITDSDRYRANLYNWQLGRNQVFSKGHAALMEILESKDSSLTQSEANQQIADLRNIASLGEISRSPSPEHEVRINTLSVAIKARFG